MGECVLEAGRCMRGEFLRCATAADISVDDEIGGGTGGERSVQGTCAQASKNRRACVSTTTTTTESTFGGAGEESGLGLVVGLW